MLITSGDEERENVVVEVARQIKGKVEQARQLEVQFGYFHLQPNPVSFATRARAPT